MDITIHLTFLSQDDPDVGYEGMRWITVAPPDHPGTSTVLATLDLDGTFAQLEASGTEAVQEPTDQPYGVRDCAFRDPAGNMVRINELR